ncbi:MAG: hypothetical protein ACR2NQ_00970 [Thermodesulfobacteriota bacterium]
MKHIVSIINTLIKWGTPGFVAVEFFDMIVEVQGTSTNIVADISVSINQMKIWLIVVPILILVIWALGERHLRKSLIKRCENLKEKQLELDQNRSSSNLTQEGKTNPEDT